MQECNIDHHSYMEHDLHYGLCVRCGLTSEDANEFDFIRAWYANVGQVPVTADDLLERINGKTLPNVMQKRRTASIENVARLLRTLVGGAVLTNDHSVVVEVMEADDGSYRAVERASFNLPTRDA